MIIRALDSIGDWTFGKGKQNYLKGIEALKLDIITRLKSWKGDCFFDLAAGVDYNNFLDIGTQSFLERDIKRVILQTPGVIKINTFESTLNRDDRNLTISSEIVTIYGSLSLGELNV